MFERGVVLEHETDVAFLRRRGGHVVALDHHGARVEGVEARDGPQQRRLAGARRSEQRGQRAVGDLDRHIVECGEISVALVGADHLDGHVTHFLWSRRPLREPLCRRRNCCRPMRRILSGPPTRRYRVWRCRTGSNLRDAALGAVFDEGHRDQHQNGHEHQQCRRGVCAEFVVVVGVPRVHQQRQRLRDARKLDETMVTAPYSPSERAMVSTTP